MKKNNVIFLFSFLILIIIFFIALMVGRYNIKIDNFFLSLFTSNEIYQVDRNIILNLRLPRTIVACLTGISLSLSGYLYQEIFRNKLTSPDLLGVSNGSGLGAAIAIVLTLPNVFISFFAFILGLGTVALTLLVAKLFGNGSNTTLLISGVIIGGFMSSCLAFIKYLAPNENLLSNITYWLMGSFSNVEYKDVYFLLPIVTTCTIIVIVIRWRINIISLGYEESKTKGINYSFYKYLVIMIATLLTTSTVCISGTISWVGLLIPNIVRTLLGNKANRNIPIIILFGAIFMIFADIISRSFTSQEIPLSAITGIFGGFIFLIMLFVKKIKNKYVYWN